MKKFDLIGPRIGVQAGLTTSHLQQVLTARGLTTSHLQQALGNNGTSQTNQQQGAGSNSMPAKTSSKSQGK